MEVTAAEVVTVVTVVASSEVDILLEDSLLEEVFDAVTAAALSVEEGMSMEVKVVEAHHTEVTLVAAIVQADYVVLVQADRVLDAERH